jgi:4-hydroxy-2-oxoheptanedioate aldolase
LKLPSTVTAEAASLLRFDYLCIDMQHGLIDRNDLLPLLQATHPHTQRTLVRVSANDPSTIGWCLDAGATGVIVPMVDSATEAEAAVSACRYPPVGRRSMGPTRASLVYGSDYVAEAESVVQCIPMIETTAALDSLDEILSVVGVDIIYVGPSDLSMNLELGPGNHDGDPAFDDALTMIVDACERHGVMPGIHANASLAPRRLDQGFKMVSVAEDLGGMWEALSGALESVRDN